MNDYVKKYVALADMLVETFGPDCEVVLHDLTDPQHSVVYIANGQVTGRMIGESFDVLVKEVMLSPKLKESYVANYYFTAKNGRLIRSSTMLIRDDDGKVQGALCINCDTTRLAKEMEYLQNFLPKPDNMDNMTANADTADIQKLVADLIEKIKFMDSRGIFMMKGSIDLVAEKMEVNKVTIYSYLDEARGKRG
ncbi:helix-turn-helix transcriptional regulator [Hungatella effluvii]|uniref:helix-turn-helix transcriptional regulator n=1 Tax=Hungatella effluvii TaxID=1096246 RepID=UPI002A803A56|nr:PAS domain-containing protein [Hungatella effluvii]